MAATMFRAVLRGWRTGVQPGCGLRRLSQTQGPPDYPSFVESVDEYQFVERLLPPATIPKPPKHEHYPTPSGWQPPRGPAEGRGRFSEATAGEDPCHPGQRGDRYSADQGLL
uniref:Large ribosomal subunit protein mL49 n=1 Tax=Equus caballus TaxID=9796 RepID=F6YVM6_HORSE